MVAADLYGVSLERWSRALRSPVGQEAQTTKGKKKDKRKKRQQTTWASSELKTLVRPRTLRWKWKDPLLMGEKNLQIISKKFVSTIYKEALWLNKKKTTQF